MRDPLLWKRLLPLLAVHWLYVGCFRSDRILPGNTEETVSPVNQGYAANPDLLYQFALNDIRAEVSGTSVSIVFTSEVAANAVISYGRVTYDDNQVTQSSFTTSHSVSLGSLPEGSYHYKVRCVAQDGRVAEADNIGAFIFHVRVFPVISSVAKSTVSATRMLTVTWNTDIAATSLLEVGTNLQYAVIRTESDVLETSHSLSLQLPSYDTQYYFRVVSADDQNDVTIHDNGGSGHSVSIADPNPAPNGTIASPYIIDTSNLLVTPVQYSTNNNSSLFTSAIDNYLPKIVTGDHTGGEVIYKFTVPVPVSFTASVTGDNYVTVDNDLHLLTSLTVDGSKNATLYNSSSTYRNDTSIPTGGAQVLPAGTYYLSVDAYKSPSAGAPRAGAFGLTVNLTAQADFDFTIDLSAVTFPYTYNDSRNTASSGRDNINSYPGYSQNESGPEYIYKFTVPTGKTYEVTATLSGMAVGVDIDIHLLSSLSPLTLIARNNTAVTATLTTGTYYLSADTYVNSSGVEKSGTYNLAVNFKDLTAAPAQSYVVQGYLSYWSTSVSSVQWNRLTHLLYFCLEPNADGSIKSLHGWNTSTAVTTALNQGKKVLISVCLFGASDIATLVNTPANRTALINNIKTQIQARNAHGVDLDFEIPGYSARNGLTLFVNELRTALTGLGNAPDGNPYRIHMALMPIDWSNAYDIASFIGSLDYAMVMSYEGHSKSSTQAGPTNKLYSPKPPWTYNFSYEYFFNHWLTKMGSQNSRKLLGGVGYYLQDFATQNFSIPGTSLGASYAATKVYSVIIPVVNSAVADGVNKILGYESTIENPYYFYLSSGTHHQVWYDTQASLIKKYDYIKSRNMGGIGIWALNYDSGLSFTWNAIGQAFP